MTTREFYNAIITNESLSEDIRSTASALLAKHDEKNSARSAKNSAKRQAEIAPIVAKVNEYFETHLDMVSCAMVAEAVGTSQQKLTPILKTLVESGDLVVGEYKSKGKAKVKGYQNADAVTED